MWWIHCNLSRLFQALVPSSLFNRGNHKQLDQIWLKNIGFFWWTKSWIPKMLSFCVTFELLQKMNYFYAKDDKWWKVDTIYIFHLIFTQKKNNKKILDGTNNRYNVHPYLHLRASCMKTGRVTIPKISTKTWFSVKDRCVSN
jgi:hypothetical protein